MTDETAGSLRRAVVQHLETLRRAGLTHLPRVDDVPPPAEPAPVVAAREAVAARKPERIARPVTPAVVSQSLFGGEAAGASRKAAPRTEPSTLPADERQRRLDDIARTVAGCPRCEELACTRTQTVFGVGDPQARLMFIGEAPGADEDATGEPFVGRAGQLLNKIIDACGFRRADLYITNILKCRPPGNRNPSPTEADNCREYLDAQLALVDPEYIVCWGSVAANNLLGEKLSIGKMRGRFFRHGRAKVLCTYHPSYLLRNPAAKKDVWDDMKFLLADMGLKPKGS